MDREGGKEFLAGLARSPAKSILSTRLLDEVKLFEQQAAKFPAHCLGKSGPKNRQKFGQGKQPIEGFEVGHKLFAHPGPAHFYKNLFMVVQNCLINTRHGTGVEGLRVKLDEGRRERLPG